MQPVLFLVLGTRGDVQPLALLAESLSVDMGFQVTLVTHVAHQVRSRMLFFCYDSKTCNQSDYFSLSFSNPMRNAEGMAPGSTGSRAGDDFVDRRTAGWPLESVAGFA